MNDITRCQDIRHSLGVYVLGAIDPAERAEVDAHLATCPDCREELAGLAGLPALLGRVPASEAAHLAGFDPVRLAPGEQDTGGPAGADDTLTPLLAKMAQRRRLNRWRALTAAAAVVVIAAGSAIGAIRMSASPASHHGVALHWETVSATDSATHTRLEVKYLPEPWGTRLDASVSGIRAGTTCEFWVLGPHGDRWQAGSWTVASTWQGTWYPGSSPVQSHKVQGFEITSGHSVLVRVTA